MRKPRVLFPSSSSLASASALASKLGIDRSQAIAKLKPKIRIIHVDAPRIIQTDAANFRDVVQRLTGKPGDSDQKTPPTSKDLIMEKIEEEEEEEEKDFLGLRNGKKEIKNEDEEEEEEDDDDDDEIPKRRSKSNKEMRLSGFFDHHGFSELDGFMEQLGTMN